MEIGVSDAVSRKGRGQAGENGHDGVAVFGVMKAVYRNIVALIWIECYVCVFAGAITKRHSGCLWFIIGNSSTWCRKCLLPWHTHVVAEGRASLESFFSCFFPLFLSIPHLDLPSYSRLFLFDFPFYDSTQLILNSFTTVLKLNFLCSLEPLYSCACNPPY